MEKFILPENPYILLTPGPLTTTPTVKAAMLKDWCTWDDDYNRIVQQIRADLIRLASPSPGYTAVLMQGSGTFSVEACLTTAIPSSGKLLVLANGAYGRRISQIAQRQSIDHLTHDTGDLAPPDLKQLENTLASDPGITHVVMVHCETTTGMLNPIGAVGNIARQFNKIFIVDAMSSFGGIPIDMARMHIDYLISSANKCIQGVPGFGFVIARESVFSNTCGNARSLSLDLFDQWQTMEKGKGKWRYTSPTHVVRAFAKALEELDQEGGVVKRFERYSQNNRYLIAQMKEMGFTPLLEERFQSPIITAFLHPDHPGFEFKKFYHGLKSQGFVIYPGKVTDLETFRIGNIGDIHIKDMARLVNAIQSTRY
ncbi:MAG: 2-aminoethylphosphonate--pyruvate transaminase [Desulfobacterales bacterium]|nr:2-aminoethylphosphonate--pyruvate transaminase [Desulfobacterales bacterium]